MIISIANYQANTFEPINFTIKKVLLLLRKHKHLHFHLINTQHNPKSFSEIDSERVFRYSFS